MQKLSTHLDVYKYNNQEWDLILLLIRFLVLFKKFTSSVKSPIVRTRGCLMRVFSCKVDFSNGLRVIAKFLKKN